jgi:hypothetical protein
MTASNQVVAKWRKSSFSQGGDCVEILFSGRAVLVRDSKDPHGSALAFTSSEWSAFLAGVRNGEFDQP